MSLMQQDYDPLHIPTQAREVFDVTGAGDTVISTLAASLGAGVSLERAMVLANLAAGTGCMAALDAERYLDDIICKDLGNC